VETDKSDKEERGKEKKRVGVKGKDMGKEEEKKKNEKKKNYN